MPRLHKCEGIILKKRSLPNKDVFISLFTMEYGKISAIAKGLKKITSQRSSHSQTGNLVNAIFYQKNDRFYLQQTSLISGFSAIKNDTRKINILYLYLFIIDRITAEGQLEPELYRLLKKFMVDLSNSSEFSDDKILSYIHTLLHILGFAEKERSFPDLLQYVEGIIQEKIPIKMDEIR